MSLANNRYWKTTSQIEEYLTNPPILYPSEEDLLCLLYLMKVETVMGAMPIGKKSSVYLKEWCGCPFYGLPKSWGTKCSITRSLQSGSTKTYCISTNSTCHNFIVGKSSLLIEFGVLGTQILKRNIRIRFLSQPSRKLQGKKLRSSQWVYPLSQRYNLVNVFWWWL